MRLPDFVSEFTDPNRIPALAARWRALEASRRLAEDAPWSHAVLRALELDAYRHLPAHEPGWLATHLGISFAQEQQALALLRGARQVRLVKGRWRPASIMTVDTTRDRQADLSLKTWAAQAGLARIAAPGDNAFSCNLFTVSSGDLLRLRELQRAYFRELRAIVAVSAPAEHVAIANMQLFSLAAETHRG